MREENSYGQDVLFFLMPAHQTTDYPQGEKKEREKSEKG